MKTLALVALSALSTANAECANACSGKGECGNKDQCICYDNYFGSDCSLQRCPSGLAFVDVPNGDLNHDGSLARGVITGSGYSKVQWSKFPQAEYWPTTLGTITSDPEQTVGLNKGIKSVVNGGGYVAAKGEAHFYQECSGKGLCDRASGECQCFDGYTGSACQRTTCPNDCSGHGRCKQVGDIAAGALNKKFVDSYAGVNKYAGVTEAFEYRLYDAEKNSACVCDLGYSGFDCSLRECPRGDDPLTTVTATCGGKACQNEVQGFTLSQATPAKSAYRVEFVDVDGNVWKSPAFKVDFTDNEYANDASAVEYAIEHLPNTLVGNVTVTASANYGTAPNKHVRFLVTFDSMPGNINEFNIARDPDSGDANVMDALVQPSEPVQYLDFNYKLANGNAAVVTGTFTATVNPDDVSAYRSTELATSTGGTANTAVTAAELVAAFKTSSAVKYELGSALPVDVVAGAANQFAIIFKNNKNRPAAAKVLGKNKVRITGTVPAPDNTRDVAVSQDAWDGNTEYSVCSNRGVCDYSSGLCACFSGYTGSACDAQSALAM